MPPKKKAKKTQTVSLDKRTQAKMLRDKASAFEAEAIVEERIHELLEPATVSANTFLLKVFHKKASAEVMLSHKKKAYLDAGFAIKECEHKIRFGGEAVKLKGIGKSSASLIDKALEEGKKVAEKFFDIVKSKGVRKAYASLPKDAEITLDEDGVLRVNGNIKEDFHARGCPFELTLNGKTWVVDGSMKYYEGSKTESGEFEGTLTHKEDEVIVNYTSGSRDFEDQYFTTFTILIDTTTWNEDEDEVLKEALEDKVFSAYEWNYHE